MKQILKIIAMILVVAAVVSAAGCAGKTNTAENKTQGASEQITHTSAETPSTRRKSGNCYNPNNCICHYTK